MDLSIVEFYGYIGNIDGYFNKNIDQIKIVQNSCKYLKNFQKNNKIRKNTHIKVIL